MFDFGEPQPRLTTCATGAGCGCKLSPAELQEAVLSIRNGTRPDELLVGFDTNDDAAVYELAPDLLLVQTVDFFTPVVDSPFDFGRIAAANALSDIYAMGARPITALNLVGYPADKRPLAELGAILEGGAQVVREAGASVVGGHSIRDPEPKYGLAVTGVANRQQLTTNSNGRPGDLLYLTKPLGVGVCIAAHQRGGLDEAMLALATATMVGLNAEAAAAMRVAGVRTATDVTGFGLLGHLQNLCSASGVSAIVSSAAVPFLPGVDSLIDEEPSVPGGAVRNAAWADEFTEFEAQVPTWRRRLMTDPTTSGGLLFAAPRGTVGELPGHLIGELAVGPPGTITVVA